MSGFSNLPAVFAIRRVLYGFIDLVYEKNGKTGERMTNPPYTSSQQCVVYKDRMYIFGGRSDSDQVFMYDMIENRLYRLNVVGTPPKIRLYHNMSLDKSRKCFYLFGGVSTKNASTYYGDLFKFDLERHAWSEINPAPQRDESIQHEWLSTRFPDNYRYVPSIESRSGHVGVYRDCEDCLVIFAGLKNGQKTNDINVFSFKEQCWYFYKPYNDSVVSPRSYCNGQYCPGTDELVVFGGDTPASLTGDTFILNFATHLWTKLIVNDPNDTLHTFPKVFGHTSILLDIKGPPFFLIAYGGTSTSALNHCYLFDITNRTWTCLNRPGIEFPKLNCCCLGFSGNSLFLYGGRNEHNQKSNMLYSMGLIVPGNILRIFPRLSFFLQRDYEPMSDITITFEGLY